MQNRAKIFLTAGFFILFSVFYYTGKKISESPLDLVQNFSKPAMPILKPAKNIEPLNFAQAMQASTANIFNYLNQDDFSRRLQDPATFAQLLRRFAKPYPKENPHHSYAFQTEAAARIGILKSMADHSDRNFAQEKIFLEAVIKNPKEHWLVKRQALRNFAIYTPQISEAERRKILSYVDERTRALASKTESEILAMSMREY